jgi:hypothetical protein
MRTHGIALASVAATLGVIGVAFAGDERSGPTAIPSVVQTVAGDPGRRT